jgi:uncharacterized FlaG/YvyC family protein
MRIKEAKMIEPIEGLAPLLNKFEEIRSEANPDKTEKAQKNRTENNKQNGKSVYAVKPEEKENFRKVDFTEISERLQTLLEEDNIAIEFSIDKDSKKMILKIIDSRTDKVLQQFPPEITLKIARLAADKLSTGNVTNARI